MRVFVYEHLCATADAASPLSAEGRAMLLAALSDFCALPDVDAVTLVGPALAEAVRVVSPRLTIRVTSGSAGRAAFVTAARGCDFALVIAPEFDDLLATRCEWALEAGCTLLGPSPEGVRLCADKLRLAKHLKAYFIPTPDTALYDGAPPVSGYPYVVKPRSGAGARATFVVRTAAEFSRAGCRAREQGYEGDLIAQPFHQGRPGSTAVILSEGGPLPLPPAEQRIETDAHSGQLRYAGGAVESVGVPPGSMAMMRGVAADVPGMFGYFGCDFVRRPEGRRLPSSPGGRGETASGGDPYGEGARFAADPAPSAGGSPPLAVSPLPPGLRADGNAVLIEINPRLTTSYVGLRRLSNVNLMGVLLDAVRGIAPPPLSWHTGRVRFDPDGTTYE